MQFALFDTFNLPEIYPLGIPSHNSLDAHLAPLSAPQRTMEPTQTPHSASHSLAPLLLSPISLSPPLPPSLIPHQPTC